MNPILPLVFFILIGSSVIWYLGTKLVIYVNVIADKMHLGRAFLDTFLLGGLPIYPS